MATAVTAPVSALRTDDGMMDTLQRSQSRVEAASFEQNGGDANDPDLSKEVAMLSTKLINAINHQTNLDDSLQATRHELDWARQEVKRVKAEKQSLDDAIAQGVLVKKEAMDRTIAELRAQLTIEKMNRENAEKSKKATEGELESLTSSLFEEANKMVEAAKKETQAVEKRNSQLKSQLNDQEAMLKTQHEQIQDIRLTLERTETNARESGSMPGTPVRSAGLTGANFDDSRSPDHVPPTADIPPDHPLHFSQLITPVLRTDISSYTDFGELLALARKGAPHSRNASGNMASASSTNLSSTNLATAAMTSSPNLPGAFSFSANSSPNSSTFASASAFTPPLKESKFYKRALIEDIEPTLRLDLAPGLSFLSRRTVNSALLTGTLSIEPFIPPTKFYSPLYACTLCGESRREELYVRRHRFRTSESEDANRYPLCDFCLARVRSTADFVGFLRMVKDGHWRCEGAEEERKAWEESVRLRERMFWARLGGGVVPVHANGEGNGRWSGVLHGADGMQHRDSRVSEVEPVPDRETATPTEPLQADVEAETTKGGKSDHNAAEVNADVEAQDASNTMPELQPQESRDFHTPEQEMPPPITPDADSDREQADASNQLQHEASSVQPQQTSTTEPTAESSGPDSSAPQDSKLEEEVPPASQPVSTGQPAPRPSARSMTSQRNLSPSKAAGAAADARPTMEERRPSSVLARVRAMEAKGGK